MHTLGKLLWFFVTPSNLLLALAALATLLALITARRVWAALALVILCGTGGAGLSPLPNWLLLPLEQRFPEHPADAPQPQGIIILGGGVDGAISNKRPERLELNDAGDRFLALIALARRYPDARLVYTGGSGEAFAGGVSEAEEVKRLAATYGLDPQRILFEPASRNTAENAALTHALVMPQAGENWLLVTSAFHMPRAIGAFRREGFAVMAYPVDFRTRGEQDRAASFATIAHGLGRIDLAAREWIGLAAYRLTGRSSAFFPAP